MTVKSSEKARAKLFRHGMSHDRTLQGTQQSSQLLPTARWWRRCESGQLAMSVAAGQGEAGRIATASKGS